MSTNNLYECKNCNYTSVRKSDFKKHLLSVKHKNCVDGINTKKYICNCGKEYSCRQSLWKHNKVCELNKKEVLVTNENTLLKEIIEIKKQNNEIKVLLEKLLNK